MRQPGARPPAVADDTIRPELHPRHRGRMAKSGNSTCARRGTGAGKVAERYTHPGKTSPMRPDVGMQAQFRKKKPPKTYRYDSSLSPALSWYGQNGARELGEWLLGLIEHAAALPPLHAFAAPREFRASDGRVLATVQSLEDAIAPLKRLSGPFLDWAGKAERFSFDVTHGKTDGLSTCIRQVHPARDCRVARTRRLWEAGRSTQRDREGAEYF
jgi:hypothetical protein